MTTVTVDLWEGKVGLPKEVLDESRIKPGSELLVLVSAGKVVLLDRQMVMERMAAVDKVIKERLKNSLSSAPDAPFFGGLTIKEYLALDEKEEDALWERLSAEVEKELRHVQEIDVPPHFIPAGQRRSARIPARRRS